MTTCSPHQSVAKPDASAATATASMTGRRAPGPIPSAWSPSRIASNARTWSGGPPGPPVMVVAVLPHDDRGAGEAVVMLHAGVADRSMWREHLDWLADAGHRAIAVDLPGFGDAEIGPGLQAPRGDGLNTPQ